MDSYSLVWSPLLQVLVILRHWLGFSELYWGQQGSRGEIWDVMIRSDDELAAQDTQRYST